MFELKMDIKSKVFVEYLIKKKTKIIVTLCKTLKKVMEKNPNSREFAVYRLLLKKQRKTI